MAAIPGLTVDLDDDDERVTPRIHTCAVCDRRDTWGAGWAWRFAGPSVRGRRGSPSWAGDDELITCSDLCRQVLADSGGPQP